MLAIMYVFLCDATIINISLVMVESRQASDQYPYFYALYEL